MEKSRPQPKSAEVHEDDRMPEVTFSSSGCCCFFIPWSSVRHSSSSWERIRSGDGHRSGHGTASDPIPASAWRGGIRVILKVREWSELVAGPKWKTFIRRFRKHHRNTGAARFGGKGHKRIGSFGYDPLSYSLNFEENGSPDRDGGYLDFSTRFAAPPASAKSSMDLGGMDAPPLFAPPALVAA